MMKTERSRRLTLLLLPVVALLAPCAHGQWDLSTAPTTTQAFKDKSGLYSFVIPKDWTVDASSDNVAFRWKNAAMSILTRPGSTDIGTLAESGIKTIKSVASDYKELNTSDAILAEYPSRIVVFQAKGPKGEKSMGRLTAVTDSKNGLVIVLTAPSVEYSSYEEEVSAVLRTLRFSSPGDTVIEPSSSGKMVAIPERTRIKVAILEGLSSGNSKKGQEVRYEVVEDILGPNREVLIPKGSTAFGVVTRAQHRGIFGKPGKLNFTVETVRAIDGTTVPLRSSVDMSKRGKSNSSGVAATALLLTPIGFLINGRDISVKKGTEFTIYVDKDTMVDPTRKAPTGTTS